jgi:hypothetical protein
MPDLLSALLIVAGLCLFETISSIDNAIINAEVLSTMGARARRWFLIWGLLFAVFIIRGVLPWLIVWVTTPSLGPWGALMSTFSSDPSVGRGRREIGAHTAHWRRDVPGIPLLSLDIPGAQVLRP